MIYLAETRQIIDTLTHGHARPQIHPHDRYDDPQIDPCHQHDRPPDLSPDHPCHLHRDMDILKTHIVSHPPAPSP
ncbi:hypothetical protein BC938DRAFT_478217, partial [Jimgerdemannia flammicorona]